MTGRVTLQIQAPFRTPEGECRRVVHAEPPCEGAMLPKATWKVGDTHAWVHWTLPDFKPSKPQRIRWSLQFREVGAWVDAGALL
jgi:hypothetical protein